MAVAMAGFPHERNGSGNGGNVPTAVLRQRCWMRMGSTRCYEGRPRDA